MLKRIFVGFSKNEIALWCSSVIFIVMSFFIFDRENFLAFINWKRIKSAKALRGNILKTLAARLWQTNN